MDYRDRKYYLIAAYDHNMDLRILKENISSLKIHPPYNHFNHPEKSTKYRKDYDGSLVNIGKFREIHQMVSCKINDADKFEKLFKDLSSPSYYYFIMEINKDICKQ